jgi:ABC-2 type transport system permease protein
MLSVFSALLRNEMRGFFRNKVAAFWSFVFPLFLFAVLYLAYGGDSLGKVKVELLDHDRSAAARGLKARLSALAARSDVVTLSMTDAAADTQSRPGMVRVVIPEGFAAATGRPGEIAILYGSSDGPAVQAAARILFVAVTGYAIEGVRLPFVARLENAQPRQAALSYGQYLLGGVLVMMMMSTGIMSTATVLAVMREHNVFRIYGCLPVQQMLFLLAIIAVRLALIVLFSSAMLLAGKYLFGIVVDLSAPRLLWSMLLIACGGVLFLSLGVLLGARVATVATATVLTNAVYFPLLFLGDLTFPLKALPEAVQHALALVPVNQLAAGLRAVLFQAPDAGAMARLVAVLLGGSMLLVAVAARTFRWGR